jgi:hypothetical protein
MKRKIVLFTTLFISLAACDRWLDVPAPPVPVPVTEINSIVISRFNIDFTLTVETPYPCWKIAGFETEMIGDRNYIAIFGQERSKQRCTETVRTATGELRFPTQEPGSYNFGFWTVDGATIDTTVVVPEL